jgi:hypothetical protein
VRQRSRFESPFLQPECITNVFRRFGNKFLVRFALRLVSLVAVGAIRVGMLVVWEKDAEL